MKGKKEWPKRNQENLTEQLEFFKINDIKNYLKELIWYQEEVY